MSSKVNLDMLKKLIDDHGDQTSNQTQFLQQSKKTINLVPHAMSDALSLNLIGVPSETPLEIAKLENALAVLSPDAMRGQGKLYDPDGSISKDYWLMCVWSFASLPWSDAKSIVQSWSRKSPRYTDHGFEQAWKSYDPKRSNGIGIGSFYKLAQNYGWQEQPQYTTQPTANDARYKLLGSAEINALQPIQWRVKHLLPTAGLAALFGESGSGKSFLALDIAMAIAEGESWFGYKTFAAPVVYLMLEGEVGLRNRINAWEVQNKRPLPENFKSVIQPFLFTESRDVFDLADVVSTGAVIFIDTLNRAAPTSDENSSKEMGEVLQAAKALQAATAGLIMIIHHTGKDPSRGMRGHSSLHAALDAAIEVKKAAGGRTWSIAKAKDGEDGNQRNFKLTVNSLGKDNEGDEITSCTVAPDLENVFIKSLPKGAKQRDAFDFLKKNIIFAQSATYQLNGCPQSQANMQIEAAVTQLAATLTTTPKNKRRNEANRLITSLLHSGHLASAIDASDDAWLWVST